MPVYAYKAIDPSTYKTIEGRLEAENLRAAKEILREQGQLPTKLEEDLTVSYLAQIPLVNQLMRARVGLKELTMFTQQLATMIDAGIPLIEALYFLEQQAINLRMQEVLKQTRADIMSGDSFSEAISRYPEVFPPIYVNMMRAGEVSGELDLICQRTADLLEIYIELQRKILGALIYPAATVFVIVAVVIFLLLWVVPQFQNVFERYGTALPLPTQILLIASHFVTHFWWALLLGVIVLGVWFNTFRLGSGKPWVDKTLISFPVLGNVILKIFVSRFIRTFSTLIGAGVSITEAIEVAASTVDNTVLNASFEKARESLLAGGTLARPLEKTNAFPPMVIKMISIGENSGNMEKMLNKASGFLDLEVDSALNAMTKLIEPIIIVVLGGIVLAVALALYLPLFDLGKVMSGG